MKPHRILCCLLLGLLLFVYFNAVFLDRKVFAERDQPVFFYPNIVFWIQSIRAGELPLWNPYIMCGEPHLANVQPGCLYPLNLLYLVLPADTAFNLSIVLHFFLAGIFTFVLMKELAASDQAAVLAATLFVFGGYLLSVQNVLSTLLSATWFPLTVALFVRCLRRRSWRHAVSAAFALYCMFAAGGMEIFMMTAAVLGCIAVAPCLPGTKISMPLQTRMACFGLLLVCFAVVGAAQILPFAELVGQSVRAQGMQFNDAVTWSLLPHNILYLFVPDVFWRGLRYYWEDQSWLKTIYTGTLPLMLSLFFFLSDNGRRRLFMTALMGIGLFLALGGYNPLYKVLFAWIPFLNTIRYPVKFFFVVIFFLCITTGLGWDCFRRTWDERLTRRAGICLLAVFGFVVSLLYLTAQINPDLFWRWIGGDAVFGQSRLPQDAIMHNIQRSMLFTILGASLLYVIMRVRRYRPLGFYSVAGLLLLDLFAGNYGYYVAVKPETLHGTTGNMDVIVRDPERSRFFVPWDIVRSEVPFTDHDSLLRRHRDLFTGNTMVEHKRFSVFGFPVLMLRHYYNLFAIPYNTPAPDATALLNMLNVKYLLWPAELNRPGYELVRTDEFYLYQNNNRLPRAFLVPDCRVVTDGRELYAVLSSPAFDPARTVLLDSEPDFGASGSAAGGAGCNEQSDAADSRNAALPDAVSITGFKNNSITLDVTSSRNQMLFLSETFYPGWKASVDGRAVRIHRANYAFRAIAVTPGRHTVRFVYDPWSFKLGAAISMFGIAGILAALFVMRPRVNCVLQ